MPSSLTNNSGGIKTGTQSNSKILRSFKSLFYGCLPWVTMQLSQEFLPSLRNGIVSSTIEQNWMSGGISNGRRSKRLFSSGRNKNSFPPIKSLFETTSGTENSFGQILDVRRRETQMRAASQVEERTFGVYRSPVVRQSKYRSMHVIKFDSRDTMYGIDM